MEKGKEGTIHFQFAIFLPKHKACRITSLTKKVPNCHWTVVGLDNGVADYCMKEDTRLEGPFTFGERPLNINTKEG